MIDKLKEYFKNTDKVKILSESDKTKEFDNISPTADTFIHESIVSNIINYLSSIKRIDIDASYNGEFFVTEERLDEQGKYIKAEEIDYLIKYLNNL